MSTPKSRLGCDPLAPPPAADSAAPDQTPACATPAPAGAIVRLLDNYQQPVAVVPGVAHEAAPPEPEAPVVAWAALGQALADAAGPHLRLDCAAGGPDLAPATAEFCVQTLQSVLAAMRRPKAGKPGQPGEAVSARLEALAAGLLRLRIFAPAEGEPRTQGQDGLSALGRDLAQRGGYLWLIKGDHPELRLVIAV